MTLAQQYKKLVDELFINPCEDAFDRLEKFEQENMISHGALEGSGWSINTRIFKDSSVYGYSCSYSQQFDFFTAFQQ